MDENNNNMPMNDMPMSGGPNSTNINMGGNASPTPPTTQEPRGGAIGPVIGIIIIIFVLIVAGLYFWGTRLNSTDLGDDGMTAEEIEGAPDPTLERLEQPLSESDELSDIEADLDADFNDLDSGLENIDAELQAQ